MIACDATGITGEDGHEAETVCGSIEGAARCRGDRLDSCVTDASIGHASVPCLDDDEDTVRVRFVADVPGVCGPSPRAQAVIDFARNVAWPAVAPAHDG